jgi:hypothetical protein
VGSPKNPPTSARSLAGEFVRGWRTYHLRMTCRRCLVIRAWPSRLRDVLSRQPCSRFEEGLLTPCTQVITSPTSSAFCHDVKGDVPNSTKSLRTSKERPRKHEWSFRCIFPIDESLSSLVVLNESAECPSRIKRFKLTKSIPLILWISLFSQPP